DLASACRGRMEVRVVRARSLWESGEERCLPSRQPSGWHAEVAFTRRIDPHRSVAEIGAVEVRGEDLLLRGVELALERECCVLELPPRCVVVAAEVEELPDLFGDRARALREGEMREVVGERARDSDEVDPVVSVEPLVFGCDDGLPEDRRGPVEG